VRPRYVHRVTREDVGSRVSIRRWVTDPERGPIPSDVVGRLLAWADDDVLRVVTRDGTRHEIEADSILASRTVPEHPSLPPEPYA
jgi:hypothetical protein